MTGRTKQNEEVGEIKDTKLEDSSSHVKSDRTAIT